MLWYSIPTIPPTRCAGHLPLHKGGFGYVGRPVVLSLTLQMIERSSIFSAISTPHSTLHTPHSLARPPHFNSPFPIPHSQFNRGSGTSIPNSSYPLSRESPRTGGSGASTYRIIFYGLSSRYRARYCCADFSQETSTSMSRCTISSQHQRLVKYSVLARFTASSSRPAS